MIPGEIITPDKKFGFDGPAGIKALQTYQRIIKSAPPGVLAYGATEQINAFYTGKAAMVFTITRSCSSTHPCPRKPPPGGHRPGPIGVP